MIPQHLEPFVLNENKGLTRALAEKGPEVELISHLGQSTQNTTDLLLGQVAKNTASSLSESILRIEYVGAKAAKQIAADIGTIYIFLNIIFCIFI